VDTRKLLAEAVGTFILVVMGSLAILATGAMAGSPALVVIPIGFGLGLLAAIAVTGHVSGGHYNPAVTLAAVLDRRLDAMTGVGYVVAQVIGAVVASAFVLLLSDQATVAGTKNMPGAGVSDLTAFAIEVVLTGIFLAVILTATKKAADHAILIIPLTLLTIHAIGIPFSGASVNPARALGPALVSMDFAAIWIYLTAPFVGAVLGWAIYRALGSGDEAGASD
jgi:aquaporin Z